MVCSRAFGTIRGIGFLIRIAIRAELGDQVLDVVSRIALSTLALARVRELNDLATFLAAHCDHALSVTAY